MAHTPDGGQGGAAGTKVIEPRMNSEKQGYCSLFMAVPLWLNSMAQAKPTFMSGSRQRLPAVKSSGADPLGQGCTSGPGAEGVPASESFFGQNFPRPCDDPVTGWELLPRTFRRRRDRSARCVASHWGCEDFTVFCAAGTDSAGFQPCPCPPERRLVRLAEPSSEAGRPAAPREDRTK